MVHTGLGQIHIRLCRQSALLPRQQRQQKARIVAAKQRANPCLHSVSQPDRPPPGRALTPRTEAGCSPAVGHQEHTLGVEHRHIIVPNPGGTLQIDVLRHPLPGTKLQKRRIAVIDELSRQPLCPHRHLGAETGLRGVVRQRHGQCLPGGRQRLHRRADLPDIQPVPPQRQCRAHKAEYRTLPLRRGQKQRKYACADTRKPHRQQPVHCQQILRGKYSGGKAAAKNSQSSHFTNFCSVRPAYRTRAAPVLLSQPHVTHGPLPLLHFSH